MSENLIVDLKLKRDPLKSWATVQPLLDASLVLPEALRPTKFGELTGRVRKLAPAALEACFGEKPRVKNLRLVNDAGTAIAVHRAGTAGGLRMHVPPGLAVAHAEAIVAFVTAICTAYPPERGSGHPESDRDWDDRSVERPTWLTVLGKARVAELGAARVAAAPAHRVEMLASGAILVATADPIDMQSAAAREALAAVFVHLHPELDPAAVLTGLHVRTERIRAQRVAQRATQFVPAPTTEWCPLADAPASDAPDSAAAVRRLDNEAEDYIAAFHDQIPSLTKQRKETLEKIDEHFLERDYWGQHGVAKLLANFSTPIGAYLGWVLVRELGGRWVPMRDPAQSYVVIGDRAWFPFARVQHYLQSREATRAYSLDSYFEDATAASAESAERRE